MKYENELNYYATHGSFTAPGSFAHLLQEFPEDVMKLSEYIHRLILIDFLPNMGIISVPQDHLADVNLRGVEAKLAQILARDDSDLQCARSFETRLLGNCRDLSLLLCAVLRNNQIPARLRSGFATFFHPEKFFDHWLCEYWNQSKERWIKVDLWMSQIQHLKDNLPAQLAKGFLELNYHPYDVEDSYFLTGGEAWINCQEKGDDPDRYGTYEEELKGIWFIRDNLIRDLLCLTKLEPLPWDCWGLMGRENKVISKVSLDALNEIAHLLNEKELAPTTLLKKLEIFEIKKSVFDSLA